jgi:predicted RNA-binding protein YlqC (UPF0109 family)
MKELIKQIIQAFVEYPEQVDISEVKGSHTAILELKVAEGDLGKVIGKGGRNINAIREIVNLVSAKGEKRIVLEIIE